MWNRNMFLVFFSFFVLILSLIAPFSQSVSLSAKGRWLVDDDASGSRVKLRCANWAAHLEVMVPEGLDRQPLSNLASIVPALGFNCVRLTWATYMYTRDSYAQLTVAQSFESLGLLDARTGMTKHNPQLLNLTAKAVHEAVITALGDKGVMVVYDNHVSKPQWCCGGNDGNGFFGDSEFDPDEWLRGLRLAAGSFTGKDNVVAVSLRNELRGRRQNMDDWYKYMAQGAKAVHEVNPKVLVFLSGLDYATRLSFLTKTGMVHLDNNKVVYEFHWYSWSKAGGWVDRPLYQTCAEYKQWFEKEAAFVFRNETDPFPLVVSEFGINQLGTNQADNKFLTCLATILAEEDLDFALWALQGNYYIRESKPDHDESYGVLDSAWANPKNLNTLSRFRLLQQLLQDPFAQSSASYKVMYHPVTGTCLGARDDQVYQEDCQKRSGWEHIGYGTPIKLKDTNKCLRATGENLPVTLTEQCNDPMSNWSLLSDLKLNIGTKDGQGTDLCLAWGAAGNITTLVTNKCDRQSDTSENQWFQLVTSNLK